MQAARSRVLIVDDDRHVRDAIARVLRSANHDVAVAPSGEAALDLASRSFFDCAIVDYDMPGIDGVECMKGLRDRLPTCSRILLTGNLDLGVTMNAVNSGEVGRICAKPITPEELLTVVDSGLETRERLLRASEDFAAERTRDDRERIVACLEDDHIQLALQPIVSADDGTPLAYEALLRSSHATLNGPYPVIKAVEEHDLVDRLADVVIDRAARWMPTLPADAFLFINLHPQELADPAALCARLERLRPWAERIVLEITERSKLSELERWSESVSNAREMGFAIAVDDLGSGYSSLSVLADLQPQFIKVDMSIIRDVDSDPGKQRIVEMLVGFAEATDARLIAEGVETAEEGSTLRDCGAHMLQGYHFGRPSLVLCA